MEKSLSQVLSLKKKIEVLLSIVLILAALAAGPKTAQYVMSQKTLEEKVCIVIDPGHGGADPGKVGTQGVKEKDINLEIGKRLKSYLEAEGIEVIMTRETDEDLAPDGSDNPKVADLHRRCEIIDETKPVMVVSIHQNSYTDSSVRGAQVFYYHQSESGKAIAEVLQECLIEELDHENGREAKANESYYMLKKTSAPTVIVECGFLSNPEEEAKLQQEQYQDSVALAICAGIKKYLNLS